MTLGGIALGLLALYVATIWTAKYGWFGLRFDGEIKPIETAGLFLNIGIAIYLQFFFVRKLANNRVEKDLLIEILKQSLDLGQKLQDEFIRLSDKKSLSAEEIYQLVASEAVLTRRLSDFENALPLTHAKSLTEKIPTLQEARFLVKSRTTKYSPKEKIKDREIFEQNAAYRNFRELITSLIFAINRHSG